MMTDWNKPQTELLTAAAKVFQALSIANPSGTYNSSVTVTLDIDGAEYSCRCDGVGIIICIITVLGYNANWGTSSVPAHVGDGWFLTDATSNFVKDENGNITPDWQVLDFDANDVRPGDIRAAIDRSHCDIFVAIKDSAAYGLNGSSSAGITDSIEGSINYLSDEKEDNLAATSVLENTDVAKVLRFVKDESVHEDTGSTSKTSTSQSLKSLDIDLQFIEPLTFKYYIKNQTGQDSQVVPGYFPPNAYFPNGDSATDSFGDSWLEFVPNYVARYAHDETSEESEWEQAVKSGLVMLYTLDNSDPFVFGRTVVVNEDGTNDYESSKELVPIICTQFPVHFRCAITTVEHAKVFGRSSAYFTNQTANGEEIDLDRLVKVIKNSSFLTDAAGESPNSSDNHGYLFLHDGPEYDRSEYTSWIQGVDDVT